MCPQVIADSQKASFNIANATRRKWIDVGLWKYSR
jgi:steroid 5-alpha reductase family enzyme